MTAPGSPGQEAQPESSPEERQPAFSIAPDEPAAAAATTSSIDAPDIDSPTQPANRFCAIARDPRCLFIYWETAPPIQRIPGAALALVIHRSDGSHEATCLLDDPGGTRIVDVTCPGISYTITLGYLAHGGLTRDDMTLALTEVHVAVPRDEPLDPAAGPSSPELSAALFSGSPSAAAPPSQA